MTFLILALFVFGIPMALTIPMGGGFDEETHTIRAWEIAHLNLIPNSVPRNRRPYPAILWNLSYRRQLLVRPVPPTFWSEFGGARLREQGSIYSELPTRSVYSPILLAPHALGIRYLGYSLRLPALATFYGSRILGVLAYASVAYACVRVIPFGKWTLAVLLLTPTGVMQATTISADPLSNAFSLLFVAGVLAISIKERVRWSHWLLLVVLMGFLFLGKVNMASFALLPFLVIPPRRYGSKYAYPLLLAAALLLGVVLVGGWAALAFPRLPNAPAEASPVAQLGYVVSSPLKFARVLAGEFLRNGLDHLKQWVAIYGYGYGVVPPPVYALYLLSIPFALLADSRMEVPSIRAKRALFVVALVGLVWTVLAMYLAVTPVGSESVDGVQGRYFTGALAAGVLSLVGTLHDFNARDRLWTTVLGGGALTAYFVGMILSFHVTCGASLYQPGFCYMPAYKNFAPTERFSQRLGPGYSVVQEVIPECDGLSAVRLWVDSTGAEAAGKTEVIVRDPASDVELTRTVFENSDLPSSGWQAILFEPEWSSRGRRYLLIVRGAGAQESGTRLALSLRPEYPEVSLAENGKEVDYDLVFQYGCTAGWQALLNGWGG